MRIKTEYLSPAKRKEAERIFYELYKHKMYTDHGVFRDVWLTGSFCNYAPSYVGYISLAYDEDKPIGVSYLPKHEYYTYDKNIYEDIPYIGYGFAGVYVKRRYRKKGLGKRLLNNVLSRSRAPMVWIEGSIAHLVETPTKLVKVNPDFSFDFPEEIS